MGRIAASGLCVAAGAFSVSCGAFIDARVEFEHFERSEPLDGVTELEVDVDYNVGMFEVRAADAGDLYSIDLDYDRIHFEPEVSTEQSGGRSALRFQLESVGTGFGGGTFENDLVLKLSDQVLLDLELSIGVGDAYVDLTGLQTRSLRFSGGVGHGELVFHEPGEIDMDRMDLSSGVGEINLRGIGNARVRELRFAGGVGSAELDFTGDWGDRVTIADVSVGVGKIDLLIPRDLPVEISSGESFLSNLSAPSFTREGGRLTRNVSDSTAAQLVIRIDSGIGGVDVVLR